MSNARLLGQACITLLLIVFINTPVANAQVTVSMPVLERSVGQTISVPVELGYVELTTGFNTFAFEVFSNSAGLVFVGHEAAGTLSESMGVASGGPLNRVGGFTSSANPATASGTLIFIKLRIDSIDAGATIELQNFTLTMTDDPLEGSFVVASTPDVPMTEFAGSVAVDDEVTVPDAFVLQGNYPNPFNPTTHIQFDLKETADVEVTVMDILGRTMLTIPSQAFAAGATHTISIDATSLTSGIYIYRVVARSSTRSYVATGTMTLIK